MENYGIFPNKDYEQPGAVNQEAMNARAVLKAQKKQLRSLVKSKLSSISEENIQAQSHVIFERLKTFQPYVDAHRVGVYLSMPTGEVQTNAIVRHALGSGKKVFVPYIMKNKTKPVGASSDANSADAEPRSVMDMVDLRSLADYESLTPDAWGIPSINADTVDDRAHVLKDTVRLDLILVPGVAFDTNSQMGLINRLGHGKGFYDFFLNRYDQMVPVSQQKYDSGCRNQGVLLYGLALKEQVLGPQTISEVHAVPTGPFDRSLHGLLVGTGEIKQGPVP